MQNLDEALVQRTLENGVEVVAMPTTSFRMVTVRALWRLEMGPRTTAQALVPMVLRRGCRRYPTLTQLNAAFESLYGANFDVDAVKMGNAHVLITEVEMPSDRYLPERAEKDTLDLFAEVFRAPLLREGLLDAAYVGQEKASLTQTLQGIYNDKAQYAHMRMLETMFEGDPYSQTRYGRLEDLERLTDEDVAAAYRVMRDAAPLCVYAVGDLDPERFCDEMGARLADLPPRHGLALARPEVRPVSEVKDVQESQPLEQGKLVLGYRCGISVFDDAYTDLGVVNGLFGAYSHSKLFRNVREKASLAYYASSRLDGFKGLLTVESGIEPASRERAQAIIGDQLADIAAGEFSDADLAMCVKTMDNQLRAQEDSPAARIMTHYQLREAGRSPALKDRIERLHRVRRVDVEKAARSVALDTAYFLTTKGEAS